MATTTFDTWLAQHKAAGSGGVILPLTIDRGGAFAEVMAVQGNRSADAFAASLRANPDASGSTLADFTITVGAYNAASDLTPVTLALTKAATAALPADDEGDGVIYLAMTMLWDPAGSAAQTLLLAAAIPLTGKVTEYA